MITNTGDIYSKNIINEDTLQSNNFKTNYIEIRNNINNFNNILDSQSIQITKDSNNDICRIDGGTASFTHKLDQASAPTTLTIQGGNITGNVIQGTQLISAYGANIIKINNDSSIQYTKNGTTTPPTYYNLIKPGTGSSSIVLNDGGNIASGSYSFCEGLHNEVSKPQGAIGERAHCEGYQNYASGNNSHAEGCRTTATGFNSHAEGVGTTASGNNGSHAEGYNTTASGLYGSHAEGDQTTASGYYSHAEGHQTTASGNCTHAEGNFTTASGGYSHAEGQQTTAEGNYSHAEGYQPLATRDGSHAEGYQTYAVGEFAHAEGYQTYALGEYTHTEGNNTTAGNRTGAGTEQSPYVYTGNNSHAEGYNTQALGETSHAGGEGTVADKDNMTAIGKYNIYDAETPSLNENKLFVVGNGTNINNVITRSDAFVVYNNGNVELSGNLTLTDNTKQIQIGNFTITSSNNGNTLTIQ